MHKPPDTTHDHVWRQYRVTADYSSKLVSWHKHQPNHTQLSLSFPSNSPLHLLPVGTSNIVPLLSPQQKSTMLTESSTFPTQVSPSLFSPQWCRKSFSNWCCILLSICIFNPIKLNRFSLHYIYIMIKGEIKNELINRKHRMVPTREISEDCHGASICLKTKEKPKLYGYQYSTAVSSTFSCRCSTFLSYLCIYFVVLNLDLLLSQFIYKVTMFV